MKRRKPCIRKKLNLTVVETIVDEGTAATHDGEEAKRGAGNPAAGEVLHQSLENPSHLIPRKIPRNTICNQEREKWRRLGVRFGSRLIAEEREERGEEGEGQRKSLAKDRRIKRRISPKKEELEPRLLEKVRKERESPEVVSEAQV